ncbi:hypothetical protein Plec18167_009274 [Paecilomyces lecythidis]|uniref:Flavonoid 3',5'-hydroxylase n=1 Tax=Paecilomyces lecythidis TaxID=3004212 RepID=A0ABR3WQ94_9EURO
MAIEGSRLISFIAPGNIALLVVGYYVFRFLWQIVYYRFFHPLSKFPGPFWASVTRLWIAYYNLRGDEYRVVYDLHKRYGPVVRITPTLIIVSDATKLPEIYDRYADKTAHYITGSFGKTESLFNMRDHKKHAFFRKIAAGPYSFTNVKKMEPLFDLRINHWISKMEDKFANTGEKFDFAPWAVYMAYDIISEVGFGAPFGFTDKGEDVGGLIQGFHDGLPAFGLMARLHPFTTWIKTTWVGDKYLVASPEQESGIGTLMRFRDRLLKERIEDMESGKAMSRTDLLQTFLDARTEDGKPLDMDYIKAEILLVLLAGADTTGTAFQGMMTLIFNNPDVYDKLMAEIDSATRAGHLSEMPQYEEVIAHCPYYIAVVKEAMRLWPSAPNIFPRTVGERGLTLAGKFVPPGTEVTCNPWIVHRDQNIYGEDAEEFHPERWLDPVRAKEFNKYNMGFGYGARVCLGRDIALMEMYKGPLQFFRKFRVEVLNKEKPAEFVVKGGVGFWKDLWVRIEKRAPVV